MGEEYSSYLEYSLFFYKPLSNIGSILFNKKVQLLPVSIKFLGVQNVIPSKATNWL